MERSVKKLLFLLIISLSLITMDASQPGLSKEQDIFWEALADFEADELKNFETNIRTKNLQQLLDEYTITKLLNYYHSPSSIQRKYSDIYFDQMINRIKAGDDINARTHYGETSLFRAIRLYNSKVLKFLLDQGAEGIKNGKKSTALITAVAVGNYDAINQLIQAGIDVNNPQKGFTPLMMAAYKRMPDAVDILLKAGADINQEDERGNTAIMSAVYSIFLNDLSIEIIKNLLQHGADLLRKNNNNKSALDIAIERGDPRIVNLLLDWLEEYSKKRL
jgi:hypothetical protein